MEVIPLVLLYADALSFCLLHLLLPARSVEHAVLVGCCSCKAAQTERACAVAAAAASTSALRRLRGVSRHAAQGRPRELPERVALVGRCSAQEMAETLQ
jgi:hypothetical protein